MYLALDEVEIAQENPAGAPTVHADVNGVSVSKRCAMTKRGIWKRARVVPRTIGKVEGDPVGQDAKVPLPTIYIGIKRLAPIGDADEKEVDSASLAMDAEDSKLIAEFVRSVILGVQVTTDVTQLSIKGSKKNTVQPGYKSHDALALSLGQDSLGSIATALASFSRLKRELGNDYVGGLLIIDELDVGFHPHAIFRLTEALKSHANRLKLQIIATTHSPRLIEAIHPDGNGNAKAPDSVVYLLDTRKPRLAEDQSLEAILDDMELRQSEAVSSRSAKPVLCVYFEDPEGAQFCDALIPSQRRAALGRQHGVKIKLIPLGLPGSNLVQLPEKDPLFKNRVLVVDADIKIGSKAAQRGNTLKLPCVKGTSGTERSPENTIKKFLQNVATADDGKYHDALRRFKVTNPSSDKIYATFFPDASGAGSGREQSKGWWVTHWEDLKAWGVLREWATCHEAEAASFVASFEAAVAATAKHLLKS